MVRPFSAYCLRMPILLAIILQDSNQSFHVFVEPLESAGIRVGNKQDTHIGGRSAPKRGSREFVTYGRSDSRT